MTLATAISLFFWLTILVSSENGTSQLSLACPENVASLGGIQSGGRTTNFSKQDRFIEIEFKMKFGYNPPTLIDQGVRLEARLKSKLRSQTTEWYPIRFYTPSIVMPSNYTSLVELSYSNDSVIAQARLYNSTLPLLLLNDYKLVVIREYICGQLLQDFSEKLKLELRWMQRFGRPFISNKDATWIINDINVNIWNGMHFQEILTEDFSRNKELIFDTYEVLRGTLRQNKSELSENSNFLEFNGVGMARISRRSINLIIKPIDIPKTSEGIVPSLPLGITAAILAIILFMVTGVVFCLCCIRYHLLKAKRKQSIMNNRKASASEVEVGEKSIPTRQLSLLHNFPKSLIISPSKIKVTTIIGQAIPGDGLGSVFLGHLRHQGVVDKLIICDSYSGTLFLSYQQICKFGVIYKGYLKSDVIHTVAIKTLKGNFETAGDIDKVCEEIDKMQYFKHPNVMSIIGVYRGPSEEETSLSVPCIVMPFMANGSLLDQLQKKSDELIVTSEDDKNFNNVKKDLLRMCLQIAKGMEYLAGQKFVHRDLAARNCLVDASGIIKVSDFGLTEDIYSVNYFRQVQSGGKLPLKWMAIESIKEGKFTEKSDIWSYGITCWEVFTGGCMPYPGIHPQEILDFLVNGGISARPQNAACGSDMYELMLTCWQQRSTCRPLFSEIVYYLTSNLEYISNYLDLNGCKKRPPSKSPNTCRSVDPKPGTDNTSRFDSLSHTSAGDNYFSE